MYVVLSLRHEPNTGELCSTEHTGGDEGVATLCQDLHQVVGQVTPGQVQTHDGVGQGVTLVDGHVVGDTITRVQHNTYNGHPHTHTHTDRQTHTHTHTGRQTYTQTDRHTHTHTHTHTNTHTWAQGAIINHACLRV